jgi:hypothetical protein
MRADQVCQAEAMAIRLFRRWSAARQLGENPVIALHAIATPLRYPVETGAACASLFELVEGLLDRALVRECCCSQAFSVDELALIGLLRCAPDLGSPLTSATIPHGLPGAICWAAMATRRALGISQQVQLADPHCPFSHGAGALAA